MKIGKVTAGALALLGLALLAPGCAGKKKARLTFAPETSAETLYAAGMRQLQRRKLEAAIATFARIDYAPDQRRELEPLVRLANADATFYKDTDVALIEARSLYLDFVTRFSDHPLAPYAQFQAGMCSAKQVNHPSKDQSQTERAIADFRLVETRYPAAGFARAARQARTRAESRLAEHEMLVGLFYQKRKQYPAAVERFRGVLDRYPTYVDRGRAFFQLGKTLWLSNNTTEGRVYLDKYLEDYPDGPYAGEARKYLASAGNPTEDKVELVRSHP
ncbi:MAG TPA: outer membrane protein assembly factor BamD [Candidatus Polarisedimenticolaceae bacterium]|nr:outer membrane protein assembly factor BamD [Candidatus Polarisedimenticolaceae bacterium]